MSISKQRLWVSLALLLVTYITWGWLLSSFYYPWFVWVAIASGVLVLNHALAAPWLDIRNGFAWLFKSDSKSFLVAVAAAFMTVVAMTWLHIFVHVIVVISSGILFKLDAQTAKLSPKQTFWILAIASLAGLGIGALAYIIMTNNF